MDIWDKFKTKDDSSLNDILSDWELFWKNMWPEDLEALSKTPQSPKYHAEGDDLTHTKMVVGELLRHNRFKTGTEQEQKALLSSDASRCSKIMDNARNSRGNSSPHAFKKRSH